MVDLISELKRSKIAVRQQFNPSLLYVPMVLKEHGTDYDLNYRSHNNLAAFASTDRIVLMLCQYNSRVTPLTCVGLSLMHACNKMRRGRFLDRFILCVHNTASRFTARPCPLKLIPLLFEISNMKLLYLQLVIILNPQANRSSSSFSHQITNAYDQQYGFPEWT